jgi:hypothetical protein
MSRGNTNVENEFRVVFTEAVSGTRSPAISERRRYRDGEPP